MINLLKPHTINLILKANHSNCIIKRIRKIGSNKFSTQVAVREDGVDKELVRTIEKITTIRTKEYIKKPQKPPFAKNLFLGIFDTDILAFPEALDKQTVEGLEKDILPIKDFFENIDDQRQKCITQQYLSNLSNLNLIGLQVPIINGGRQLTLTESCRYLEEISKNSSRIGIIDNEQLGVQMLFKYGYDKHKKYLEQLMNGKAVVSFCITEASMYTPQSFKTKATLSSDKKTWIINGTKEWVVNATIADFLIVFAEAEKVNEEGIRETSISAFVVEKNFGGISSKQCEATGLDQTDISNITFENTPVPAENLIGEIKAGDPLISSLLTEYRLSKGPMCIALLKNAINKFINHCIKIDGGSNNIVETDAVQSKIGELITALYVIESITYLTAGLLDQYENQDCDMEAAIVKLLSANYCHSSVANIMDFMGTSTYMKDNWCNQLYRDSLAHILLNEPPDSSKISIALLGLQHAGIALNEKIKMLRNPLYNAAFIFKRMWTEKRHIEDNPKLTLRLHDYLHPSSLIGAQFLEYSVLRLQFATETLLSRYGPEIVNKHVELKRLADCITDIYAMAAVLGRSSRAYCIGLRHADIDMQIATAFTSRATERVKDNVKKIWLGTFNTADEKYLKIGEYAIKQKEYFPVHSLSRNY